MRPLLIPLALLIGSFALTACSTPPAAPTPTLVPLAGDETTATVMPTTRPLPSVTPLPTATATLAPTLTAVSATATATVAPGAVTPAVTVIGDAAIHVRSGPGTAYPIVGRLLPAVAAKVSGRDDNGAWWQITLPGGQRGWVAASLVRLTGEPAALPVVKVAPAPTVRPQPAPAGKIVFQESNGGSIYLVNADGSGLRRLTSGFDPALAPDGQRVAFTRWNEPRGVWIYDLRTNEEYLLVQANGARTPTWSPDGSELAFAWWRKTIPGRQVCIGDFCFDIPPEDYNGLATVRVDEKILRDLPASQTVQSPAWEPNGLRIVYRGKQGLKFTEPGSADAREDVLTANLFQESPAWSPDGQHLLVQTRLHDHRDIFMLDRNGRVVARLTANDPLADRAPNNVAPAWSPDGRQVIFLSDRSGSWQVTMMEADGSNPRLFLPAVFGQMTFRYDFAAERMFDWGS
ncbi:MAG: SH3 domain-containing protein [Anaerolineae bacterium]